MSTATLTRPADTDPTTGELSLLSAARGGGFTYNPHTGDQPAAGFSVATLGHSTVLHGFSAMSDQMVLAAIRGYIADHLADLLADPELHLGGWHDESDDTFWLDLPQVLADRDEAVRRGVERNERSVADLAAIAAGDWDRAFIDCGGTGNA